MAQNFGLGRGLSSLIPKKSTQPSDVSVPSSSTQPVKTQSKREDDSQHGQVLDVDVSSVVPNPHQPRLNFDDEKLEELSHSIKSHGIIQPLVVSMSQDRSKYELIAGERRLQAAKRAGLNKVPVIVRDAGEKEKLELAIIENIQRHDLNAIEEAKAYKKLLDDYQMNQDEVALKMGKSRSAVANKIRLLNLPVEVQRAVMEGKITEGHAKAILALDSPEKQRALFELIIKNNLTVRQVESKAKEVSVKSYKRAAHVDPEIKDLEEKLIGVLGTKVKVVRSGDGGKIMIDYYSQEDLNSILEKIAKV